MANFYATYPASNISSVTVQTVQGEGIAGTPTGGVLTIQGDPAGTPIPISGSITATNPSVAPTAAAVPADATYIGMDVGGDLTGLTGTSSGLNTVINAALPAGSNVIGAITQSGAPWSIIGTGIAGTPATAVVTIQGISGGTTVPVSGTVTATIASVGTTGSAVPANADYLGASNGGTLIGVEADSSGRLIVAGAGTAGSANGGVLTIQGSAGGTAVPVTVSSVTPQTVTTVTWQAEGNIAAGSVTGSFQTVFTPAANTKILFMRNNTNASISVSMDAGTTTNFIMDSGDQVSVDFQANALVSTTTAIQIKQTSGAPSTGSFRVNGGH